MEKEGKIKGWVIEAINKGYSNEEINGLLLQSGFKEEEIKEVFLIRSKLGRENEKLNKQSFGQVSGDVPREIKEVSDLISRAREEVEKVVIGQRRVIDAFMCAILCDGHVLLEGVPGVAKTTLINCV